MINKEIFRTSKDTGRAIQEITQKINEMIQLYNLKLIKGNLPDEYGSIGSIKAIEGDDGTVSLQVKTKKGWINLSSKNLTSSVQADSSSNLPAGGLRGQVLGKRSDNDYDVFWEDESGSYSEPLIGTIDGVNKEFYTTYDYLVNSTKVKINGLEQMRGVSYYEAGSKKIVFDEAPLNIEFDDVLTIDYRL